jgi:hypothetical protein
MIEQKTTKEIIETEIILSIEDIKGNAEHQDLINACLQKLLEIEL